VKEAGLGLSASRVPRLQPTAATQAALLPGPLYLIVPWPSCGESSLILSHCFLGYQRELGSLQSLSCPPALPYPACLAVPVVSCPTCPFLPHLPPSCPLLSVLPCPASPCLLLGSSG
jgi:hypothetical protein